MNDPRHTYATLLEQRRTEIAFCDARQRTLGNWRLATVAAALVMLWLALVQGACSVAWLLVPAGVFVALIVLHERLVRELERRRRAERYFERAISRLDGSWQGTGDTGDRYLDPTHPFAADLDLFGPGSLFELISTARTHIGEDTLARWLLSPAAPEIVVARQQAVEELRPRLDLRESLAVLAEEARTGVDPVSLAAWGETPPALEAGSFRFALWIHTVLGYAGLASAFAMAAASSGLLPLPAGVHILIRDLLLVSIVANGWFLYRRRRVFDSMVSAVEEAAHELRLLADVLLRIEKESFRSALLVQVRASLDQEGDPPSRRMARLNRLVEYLDSRDNVFVRVLEVFILWTPHLAVRVEEWRRHSGPAVRRWLEAIGDTEALCSLASHAFGHPEDTFPEFASGEALLQAEGVAHPLLPEGRGVRNSVSLGGTAGGSRGVLVVSGSNMSGKSTLLRTIGTNVVLAQAGGPVRARRLRISRFAVGASIRVSDSLQGGVSRFYAEILRIRQIVDQTAGPLPVLFLIDEFLQGTNSHDRRIGAAALVEGLVRRGAVGIITTHDLALAEIAAGLGERAANVHFEDSIRDGKMEFDYLLRPGVVTKSNALELMRSVGLDI